MGLQPVRIPNGLLIFKDLAVRGLWISRWYKNAPQSQRERLFEKLFHWAGNGVLHTPVEAVYSLQNHREALAHAMRAERSGKVLFKG